MAVQSSPSLEWVTETCPEGCFVSLKTWDLSPEKFSNSSILRWSSELRISDSIWCPARLIGDTCSSFRLDFTPLAFVYPSRTRNLLLLATDPSSGKITSLLFSTLLRLLLELRWAIFFICSFTPARGSYPLPCLRPLLFYLLDPFLRFLLKILSSSSLSSSGAGGIISTSL